MTDKSRDDGDPFEIDVNRLDWEWNRQPSLMRDAVRAAAEARRRYNLAKANLEQVDAELGRGVRRNPLEFGLEKVTEKSLEEAVITHKGHVEAQRRMIDARHDLDVLEGEVESCRDRKATLENLVVLWCRDYVSEPRIPRGLEDQVDRDKLEEARGGKDRWEAHEGTRCDYYD